MHSPASGRKPPAGATVTVLLVLGAVWGSSYLFIELALDGFRPAVVAWGRQVLSAVVLLTVAALTGGLAALAGRRGRVLALAVVMIAVPTLLLPVGQQWVNASLAAVLVASTPVMTGLALALTRPGARLDRPGAAGTLAGLIGVVIVVGLGPHG